MTKKQTKRPHIIGELGKRWPYQTLFSPLLLTLCLVCCLVPHFPALAAEPPFDLPVRSELAKIRSAVIETSKGSLYFELFPEEAPWHVTNFKYLADKGWYKNLSFHIFFPQYIIQGGAPFGQPDGGPGYSLPAEFNTHQHVPGTLGMARVPNFANPERRSSGCQFHILMTEAPKMDGAYTIFGQLKKGFDVLERLEKGDAIRDVRVYVRER